MARRIEDVEQDWDVEDDWEPSPEEAAQLARAEAQLDRGEFVPWSVVWPRMRAAIAACDVLAEARDAAGIPEGQHWTPPPDVAERVKRAREAALVSSAGPDELP